MTTSNQNRLMGSWAFVEPARLTDSQLRTAAVVARESEEARLAARRAQAEQRMNQSTSTDFASIGRRIALNEAINANAVTADRFYISNMNLDAAAIGGTHNHSAWTAAAANPYKPPRSENLDIHPRHGGDIPNDVTQAAHLLRNWMVANQCEMLNGMTIDRDAMFEAPRFTPVENLEPRASTTRYYPPAGNMTADEYQREMVQRREWEMRRMQQQAVMEARAETTTPHRWSQPDRQGRAHCLACNHVVGRHAQRPATGCTAQTPQEARAARSEPNPLPSMRPMRVLGHSLLYVPPYDHYTCAGCGGTWAQTGDVISQCSGPR